MKTIFKVSTQTSWQLIGKFFSALSTLFLLRIVTQSYGESGTGVFTLALTYLTLFHLAGDLSLNAYILPKLESAPKEASRLLSFRLWWSVLLIIVANILTLFLPIGGSEFRLAVLLGSVSILFSGVFTSCNLIFQSKLRYDHSVLANSFGAITVIPLALFLVSLDSPVYLLALAPVGGWVVNNITALVLARRHLSLRLENINLEYPLQILKVAWPLALTLLLNTVYFRVDTFILSVFRPISEVGVYNLAYQLFQTALVFPTFIMNSYYPLMLASLNEDYKIFKSNLLKAGCIMVILGIVAAVISWMLSPTLVGLASGGGFEGSVASLRILSLSFPAFFLSALLMWTLVSLKRYKVVFLIYATGLVINIILNYLYIPTNSYIAASWITGICEYLILIMQLLALLPLLKSPKIS